MRFLPYSERENHREAMRPLVRSLVQRTVAPAMPPLFLLHAALLI